MGKVHRATISWVQLTSGSRCEWLYYPIFAKQEVIDSLNAWFQFKMEFSGNINSFHYFVNIWREHFLQFQNVAFYVLKIEVKVYATQHHWIKQLVPNPKVYHRSRCDGKNICLQTSQRALGGENQPTTPVLRDASSTSRASPQWRILLQPLRRFLRIQSCPMFFFMKLSTEKHYPAKFK